MYIQKANFHTHSTFCDGKNSAEEMILCAIEKGFDTLGFSSHCIHPLNPEFYQPVDNIWHIKSDNIKNYTKEISRLKEKYADKIKIYLGFEADFFESKKYGNAIPIMSNYSEFSPDYLIGAVHFINTINGFFSVDHKPEIVKENLIRFYTKKDGTIDGKKVVCDYFSTEREMLANFFNEEESWYKAEIKATAKAIAKAGVIAEINTGAIARGNMDDTYPSQPFLELMHEYKVPVCINSDAHTTNNLDAAFERAIEKAKKAGYTELIYPCGNFVKL